MYAITKKQMAKKFKKAVREIFGTQAEAARYFEVHPSFIANIIRGRASPNPAMLDMLSLKRVIVYVKDTEDCE